MTNKDPKPWYSKGLRFECTRCGNCCRSHGEYSYVYLTEADLTALTAHLELTREEVLERWCSSDGGWTVLRMDRPACPFLSAEGGCEVYPARPKQCRTWPFWEDNLERSQWEGPVSDCCPGLGSGPLHSAEEVERIARETEEWYAE